MLEPEAQTLKEACDHKRKQADEEAKPHKAHRGRLPAAIALLLPLRVLVNKGRLQGTNAGGCRVAKKQQAD